MRLRLCAINVLVAGALSPDPAIAQAPQATLERRLAATIAAVVTLRSYDVAGSQISQGTGFFLPDGRIATNRHILEGASVVEARAASADLVGSYSYASAIAFSADLAILPKTVEPSSRISLAPVSPSVGTHVYVVGAPLGLEHSLSDGIVSGVRTLSGQNLLQMTAPVSPGSSGGPVVNDAGLLVGVTVAQIPDGQNLNFAVPVQELRGLLASPQGRVGFPPRPVQPRSEPTESSEPLPGLLESLPASAVSINHDVEWRIEFLGCYGNRRHDVIICACDFTPSVADGKQRTIGVWRATLQDLGGGHAVSDMSGDLSTTFPFSGGGRGVKLTSSGGSNRLFLRFITPFDPTARPVFELGVGNREVERTHRFPPVPIVKVDEAKDEFRLWFGAR